jgi:hypothetical protein
VGTSLNDVVYAIAPTTCTACDALYVGGTFATAGGTTVNNIAWWNGATWISGAFGSGVNGTVNDISVDSSGNIFIGGNFSTQFGNNFAYWNTTTSTWAVKLSTNDTIYKLRTRGAFTTDSSFFNAYLGGVFTSPGNQIVKYDAFGSPTTVPLGTGITGTGTFVDALGLSGPDVVYSGGGFGTAGCRSAGNFAQYFEHQFFGSEFSGDWHTATNWTLGTLPQTTSGATLGNHDAVISTSDVNIRDLRIENAHVLTVDSGRALTVSRNLNINTGFINGGGTVSVTQADPNAIYGGGSSGFISNALTRSVNNAGSYNFPVGDSNYAPVTLTNISGSGSFSVTPHSGAYAGAASGLPANRLKRWWNLTNGGITGATVTFHYNDSEIGGTEANYKAFRISNGVATQLPTVIDTVNNTATVTGVTQFSDWTLADASSPPAVTTLSPGSVGLSNATLSAQINPNGLETVTWWRDSATNPGTCDDTFGQSTPHYGGAGSGTQAVNFSQTEGGLSPSTT